MQKLTTNQSSFPLGRPGTIIGWGVQNDADHAQPVNELGGLNIVTTLCSEIEGIPREYTALWEREPGIPDIPIFICVRPTANGGVCTGDEGGAGLALLILGRCTFGPLLSNNV